MYYIISCLKYKDLLKYPMPIGSDGYDRDLDTFYNSPQGKEFLKIDPIRILFCRNRTELKERLIMDMCRVRDCYNIPIYITILSNNLFNRLNWQFSNLSHMERCATYLNLSRPDAAGFASQIEYLIPENEKYYSSNGLNSNKLEEDLCKIIDEMNMKKTPLIEIYLNNKNRMKIIYSPHQ